MRTTRRARIERVLAGIEHAREIVERGIGIGAAHRLVQRGDQVVVAVLAACRRSARGAARSPAARAASKISPGARGAPDFLGQRQRGAAVAVGHADQRRARLGIERQRLALDLFGARQQLLDRRLIERPETPARARATAARAFSSKDGFSVVAPTRAMVPSSITGRKESCCARLKRWISSTNSSVPCPLSRRARAASNTFFRSATPEKIAEICSKCSSVSSRQQPRHRGLAGAGRAPEHQRAERARLQHARQRAVGAEQMILADHLGELLRPQPVGERARRIPLQPCGREQAAPASFGP